MRNSLVQKYKRMLKNSLAHAVAVSSTVVLAAMMFLPVSPGVAAEQQADRQEHWSDWKALSKGYVGRRKQPAKVDEPVTERRLPNVKERPERVERLIERQQEKAVRTGFRNGERRRSHYKGNQSEYSSARYDYGEYSLPGRRGGDRGQKGGSGSDGNDDNRRPGRGGAPDRGAALDALWLRTGAEGLYGVSLAQLAAELGQGEGRLRGRASSGRLSITEGGEPVAWHFDRSTDRILFPGRKYETFHTDENVYRLSVDAAARPMTETNGAPTGAPGSDAPFRDVLHFEEEPDMQYALWAVSSEPDADYWFWDYLYGGFKDVIEADLYVPDPASGGTARLQVNLRGWTDLEAGDEHQVYAELNGVQVGPVVTWDAFEPALLTAEFDQSLLDPSGHNTLHLRNIYAAGTHPGQFLDDVSVEYLRQPVAREGALWLHGVSEGIQTVRGLSTSDVLVIESPLEDAVLRSDVRVEADGGGGFQVTLETGDGVDYLVVEHAAVRTAFVEIDERAGLDRRDNGADYLIVAPREFAATAQALAEHRRNRFGAVQIVWLDEIYSEFSHGRTDPFALTRFMKTVQQRWRVTPTHVVLVGKGSLDHKDRMGYSDSFLPTVMTANPWSLAASDHRLLNGDGDAGFAIGRIPVTNDGEGLAYVDKVAAYESAAAGPEKYQAVLAADNPDAGGPFHANSDLLADRLTLSLGFDGVTRLYHPRDPVRQDLILSSTWETGYVSYDGHGSATQIGDGRENFLTAVDADALSNKALPIFTALTCSVGNYTMPGTQSLAGSLVLSVGGAIASLAPTAESLDSDAQVLNNAFVDNLFAGGMTIGDAARQAKLQTRGTISDYIPGTYGIIGDPGVYAR